MDNPKVVLGKNKFGKCLLALDNIAKDKEIARFDGPIYKAEKCTDLPKDVADHAIQISEHEWQESSGNARFINHSCDPNCGIKGLNILVAMKDIVKGQELTWDYDMTEDSDWRMECACGSVNCRKTIGAFVNVPDEVRKKYQGYISDWLVKKYRLEK